MEKTINYKWKNTVPYLILAAVGICLLYRARFGFIWSDESYYFEEAYRFLQGDAPVVDDWYTSQLYSVLLIPYMYLWKCIAGIGFSYLFLFSRYLYVIIQFIAAVICYRILRKRSCKAALIAAVLFMLFCRGNIATLSYYSICTVCLFIALLILFRVNESEKGTIPVMIFSGALSGIAIICNPYLMALYVVMVLFLIFMKKRISLSISGREAIALLMGTVIILMSFATFILSRASFSELLDNIKYIMSDSSYYSSGIVSKLFSGFLYTAHRFIYTIGISTVSGLFLLFNCIKKRRLSDSLLAVCFCVNTVILIVDIIYPQRSVYTVGSHMAALAIWGWQIFFVNEKKDWDLFLFIYLPGCISALLMSASSDTHFSAMTQGYMIAAVASVIFGFELAIDKKQSITVRGALLVLSMLLVVISALSDRILYVYRDGQLNELNVEIRSGPGAGIITTAECTKRYNAVSDTMNELGGLEGNIYILNFCPWGYLYSDMRCSTYTSWRISPETEDDLGNKYYIEHPDKYPDVVVRLSPDYMEYDENTVGDLQKQDHLQTAESIVEAWNNTDLIRELEQGDYRKVKRECGTIYIRNDKQYQNVMNCD